jgi:hypothetical protein
MKKEARGLTEELKGQAHPLKKKIPRGFLPGGPAHHQTCSIKMSSSCRTKSDQVVNQKLMAALDANP